MSKKATTDTTVTAEAKQEFAQAFARTAELLDFKQGTPEYEQLKMSMGVRYAARETEVNILAEGYRVAHASHRPWHTPARTAWDIATVVTGNLVTVGLGMAGVAAINALTSKKETEEVMAENDVFSNPTTSKFEPLKAAK